MSHEQAAKLVKMANQIGKFFASQKHTDAAAQIAEHLAKFWEPRMRDGIIAHVKDGGAGLDAAPLEAVKRLAAAEKK